MHEVKEGLILHEGNVLTKYTTQLTKLRFGSAETRREFHYRFTNLTLIKILFDSKERFFLQTTGVTNSCRLSSVCKGLPKK